MDAKKLYYVKTVLYDVVIETEIKNFQVLVS